MSKATIYKSMKILWTSLISVFTPSAPETRSKVKVTVNGNTVNNYRISRAKAYDLHKKASGLGDAEIIRHANSTADARVSRRQSAIRGPSAPTMSRTIHNSSTRRGGSSRDFSPNNKKVIKSTHARSVFEEDKDAMSGSRIRRDDRRKRENHLPSDEGAVKMRRIVYKRRQRRRNGITRPPALPQIGSD